jgi:hypothetical protein
MAATAVIQVMVAQHVLAVQNSALQTPMPHAHHAPRVHSLKLVLQRLTVHATSVQATVVTIALLAKTAVDTRVVQSDQALVAMIARLALVIVTHVLHTATAMTVLLAKTAVDTRVVQSVLHTVVQVQLPVVATVVK